MIQDIHRSCRCIRVLDDIEVLIVDEGVPGVGLAVGNCTTPTLTRA